MTPVKLAWRNIWRNKRRTLITMASIFFAVVLSSFMMSIKEGMYAHLIYSTIGTYAGYIQVHNIEFVEDRNIDNGFVPDEKYLSLARNQDNIRGVIPRIESFALAASHDKTRGSLVVGTDVTQDSEITQLHERVSSGAYLRPGEKAVLVGNGLAEYLGLEVGDTIVLLSQGYHGASAAAKYPINGILKFGSPELSKQLVLMPLETAQEFYSCPGIITQLNVWTEGNDAPQAAINILKATGGGDLTVRPWQEVMPEIDKMISADRVEGYVFMFILYLVISFGIFGTILMMLVERNYEFGMLLSLGMKRGLLGMTVWFEAIFLSLLGAMAGVIGAIPVCYYFNINPIRFGDEFSEMFEEFGFEPVMRTSLDVSIFMQQATVVGLLACLLSLYPYFKIIRMRPLDAMRA